MRAAGLQTPVFLLLGPCLTPLHVLDYMSSTTLNRIEAPDKCATLQHAAWMRRYSRFGSARRGSVEWKVISCPLMSLCGGFQTEQRP